MSCLLKPLQRLSCSQSLECAEHSTVFFHQRCTKISDLLFVVLQYALCLSGRTKSYFNAWRRLLARSSSLKAHSFSAPSQKDRSSLAIEEPIVLGQQNGSAVRGLRVAAVLDLCGRSIERRLSCARLQTIDTRNARTRGGRLSAVLYSDLRAQSLRCTGPLDCGFCARHQDLRVGAASPSLSAPRARSGCARERRGAGRSQCCRFGGKGERRQMSWRVDLG